MGIKIRITVCLIMFVLLNTSALIGQNTDWSLLTPELGGTLRLGIAKEGESKWFSECDKIKEKNSDRETQYLIKDELLGKGEIEYTIRPLEDSRGAVMRLQYKNLPEGMQLIWCYGGASNQKVDNNWKPVIVPADCDKNVFSIEGSSFTLYYGTSRKLKILEAETPVGGKLILGDANQQKSPLQLIKSGKKTNAQVLTSVVDIDNSKPMYFCFYFLNPKADYNYFMMPELFESGKYRVNKETEWMKSTPD